jgi:hypothetical protein
MADEDGVAPCGAGDHCGTDDAVGPEDLDG